MDGIRNRAPQSSLRVRAAALLLALGFHAVSRAEEPLEYQVKAAYLLNFTKFVEWPASAFAASNSPIAICILGDDPFGSALDQMVAGEVVNGRGIVIRKMKSEPALKTCQMLFVSLSEKDPHRLLPGLGPGVLTVGEGENFIREGGMIGFVMENRHVRFGINQAAAEAAGLKVSSKLLNVARPLNR
jgi:hypothetical protein